MPTIRIVAGKQSPIVANVKCEMNWLPINCAAALSAIYSHSVTFDLWAAEA